MKNNEQSKQPEYLSYLMRVWREPRDSEHVWRASLEEAITQQVYGFKDLQSLFAFLLAQTEQQGQQPGNVQHEAHITLHER